MVEITHRVRVNRSRTPEEALAATGRKEYVDSNVVATMPRGTGEEVEIVFFKPRPEAYKGGIIYNDQVAAQYEFHGLTPVDPYALAAYNEGDPAFADEHPNATVWKDKDGNWCYAAFDRWRDERHVNVRRNDGDWSDFWSFAGVRKQSTQTSGAPA